MDVSAQAYHPLFVRGFLSKKQNCNVSEEKVHYIHEKGFVDLSSVLNVFILVNNADCFSYRPHKLSY